MLKNKKNNLMNSITDVILIVNMDHRVMWINSTATVMYPMLKRWRDRACYKVLHFRDKPCEECLIIKKSEKKVSEIEIRTPDLKIWSRKCYPVCDKDDLHQNGRIILIQDITEKRLLEKELFVTKQLLKRFEKSVIKQI